MRPGSNMTAPITLPHEPFPVSTTTMQLRAWHLHSHSQEHVPLELLWLELTHGQGGKRLSCPTPSPQSTRRESPAHASHPPALLQVLARLIYMSTASSSWLIFDSPQLSLGALPLSYIPYADNIQHL